jgi:hypothetical protein
MSFKLHASFGSVSWCFCGMQWNHEITTWASVP